MKTERWKNRIIGLLAVVALLSAWPAPSAAEETWGRIGQKISTVTCAWSGASSNFTVEDNGRYGYVMYAVIVPTGSPTASYDVTITNAAGLDIFGSQLNNLSASAVEVKEPSVPYILWTGQHTFTWANQSEAGASGTVTIYIIEP